jgi:histidine triad (HIT) family protein
MNTIFKKIIDRELPADIVYEDDTVLAFLDVHPIRKGHTLIIPKHPYVDIYDIDPVLFGHMAQVAQQIARTLMRTMKSNGINIHMNNGEAAGQDVFHAHMHVIPRFTRDEAFEISRHETYENGEAARVAAELRRDLSAA